MQSDVIPDAALCERLRKHVQDRGGAAIENGAWQMMLEAADRLESLSRQLSDAQRERDELRAAVSEWLRYRNSMLSGDCDTQAGEYAAVKKLESMVKHTEGGKP